MQTNKINAWYKINANKKCYIPFIEAYGFKACKVEIINGHKPTVKEFALTHPQGIYILRVANHIVTVKNGLYFDSWDSGDKSIYKYWMI
ncbi:MAG: hypothetical protein ACKVQK_31475 [Burkholderiales bacterium]